MSASAVHQIIATDEDDFSQEQMVADQAEIDPNEITPPEVLAIIDESVSYFERGGEGVPHEVVMQGLRATIARR